MNFSDQIFINPNKLIAEEADIIYIADLFEEDYAGGAELTSAAILEASPLKIQKIKSKDVNLGTLQQGHQKFWIFGNFSQLNPELIPTIAGNLNYSILEYDYKYCKFRSPEKHKEVLKTPCDCHNNLNGKLISAFYYGSKNLWWMSEKQKERYMNLFPFLLEKDNVVLSSVFSKRTLGYLKTLRSSVKNNGIKREKWIVLGSDSWVKGFENAKKWCEDNQKDYEVVWNLPYEKLLEKLSRSEGLVYLPSGADTCPRLVIEAKLLDCKLIINDFVQHRNEDWFNTDDIESIYDYLSISADLFWKTTKSIMNWKPTLSGYTTTYNCLKQDYPFLDCIKSMLQFCDEVCVVDGGSTDGTLKALEDLSSQINTPENQRLKVKIVERDWKDERHAVFDGMQKAEARSMCTGNFCWQMDSDEIVHQRDFEKIKDLCTKIPKHIDIISLPVIEYWGGYEKVRLDIQPWKWRLSRNLPHITHGIPSVLRRYDSNGKLYSLPGSDGCDMIHKESGEPVPHVTFHSEESERVRRAALGWNKEAIETYQSWFEQVIENLPSVHHYSWFNMSRKIKLYKEYWTKHWNSLYNQSLEDTAESNMMFNVPWSQVTDQMIEERAKELSEKTGGWIWHKKWNGELTPHLSLKIKGPI